MGERVVLNDWTPTLATRGPVGNHFRQCAAAGVAIADVTLTRSAGGELESIVRFLTHGDQANVEDTLIAWARLAGHRRIWLEDRVVETGVELPEAGVLGVTCATCAARWEEHHHEFHTFVRSQGIFPSVCPLCGGVLPQWSLEARTPSEAGHDARRRSPWACPCPPTGAVDHPLSDRARGSRP